MACGMGADFCQDPLEGAAVEEAGYLLRFFGIGAEEVKCGTSTTGGIDLKSKY